MAAGRALFDFRFIIGLIDAVEILEWKRVLI